jgi:hypothetical protein
MSTLLISRQGCKWADNCVWIKWFQRAGLRKKGLQRNRIDADCVRLTVVRMKQIEIKDATSLAPLLCEHCSGLMRLIGSEPHPTEAKTDLLTYSCTGCGEFQVVSVPIPA